jgi:flagellar protein FlbD
MIKVTRLDNTQIIVNVEMIQSVLESPDTVITFTNNVSMMVKEPVNELTQRIIEYQKTIHNNALFESNILNQYANTIN